MSDVGENGSKIADGYFKAYEHYAALLRTWLVAYGIGAPAITLTNEALWKLLGDSGESRTIATLFLFGVALQVLLATFSKTLMWASYYAEINKLFKETRRFAFVKALRSQFWIDIVIDVVTLGLFGAATYKVFIVVTGYPTTT